MFLRAWEIETYITVGGLQEFSGREVADKKTQIFTVLGRFPLKKRANKERNYSTEPWNFNLSTSIYHGNSNFNLPYGFHFTTVD